MFFYLQLDRFIYLIPSYFKNNRINICFKLIAMLLSDLLAGKVSNPIFAPIAFFPQREQKYILIFSDFNVVSFKVLNFTTVYKSTSLL